MAMTIDDYKKQYAEARARGDAAGMKAANDAANALRRQMGQKEEYAGEDIAKAARGELDYTPINASAAQMVNEDAFHERVAKQQQYIQENPTAVRGHTREEYRERYGDIYDNAPYTAPADRVVPKGESGADAGLMSSGDYAVVQHLKGVWADSNEKYKQALDAGDDESARYWLAQRDNAHLEAERVRAHYNYSGGEDGSMYMDFDFSPLDVESVRGEEDDGWDEEDGGHSADPDDDWDDEDDEGGSRPGTGATLPQAQPEDFSRYLEELYAARTKAALAELEAAYQKNLNAFDRSEAGIDGAWRAARNQTVADSELAAQNFHEYAAARGLNNGTAGQAQLARNVALQGNLNTINAERASSVAELQLQRANAEVEYNNAIAQAEAKGDYELAAALYEEKVRVQELLLDWEIQQQKLELQWYQAENQVRQDDEALDIQRQKHKDSVEQAWQEYQSDTAQKQRQTLAQYGQLYLKQGVMPSDEMLAAMGITREQAQAYIRSVLAK